jgi:hypothetical protein
MNSLRPARAKVSVRRKRKENTDEAGNRNRPSVDRPSESVKRFLLKVDVRKLARFTRVGYDGAVCIEDRGQG